MRILYVEDNPANLFLIKRVAKMGDHEVINLIDGEEALRKIDLIKPDLILMDIQLAGQLTGLDVVRKLRQDGLTIPIVAVTAYAMVGDRERCLEAGCNEYLSKPLPIGRVVQLLQLYQEGVPVKVEKESDEVYLPIDRSTETPTVPAVPTPLAEEEPAAVPTPTAPASDVAVTTPAPTEAVNPSTSDTPAVSADAPAAPASPDAPAVPSLAAPVESRPTNSAGVSESPTQNGGAELLSQSLDVSSSPVEIKVTGEPPTTLPEKDVLSDHAVEPSSQDTSHSQDTVQAQ